VTEPPYSGRWLKSKSDEELEGLIEGSFPRSPAFEGATGELARRKAARSEKRQLLWIKLTFGVSLIAAVAAVLALF
jgi:type VI protein secretion system component VasF